MDKFNPETTASILDRQDMFGHREVGVIHPDVSSFLRLRDNGDIEIMTGDGLGIVMSRSNQTMTLMAKQVRVLTHDGDGFFWNQLGFNKKATAYNEPTFFQPPEHDMSDLYKGAADYFPPTDDPTKHTDADKKVQ